MSIYTGTYVTDKMFHIGVINCNVFKLCGVSTLVSSNGKSSMRDTDKKQTFIIEKNVMKNNHWRKRGAKFEEPRYFHKTRKR